MAESTTGRVVLIGWEAADWEIARPLLHRGWMPNLQLLMNRGRSAILRAPAPLLSPTLWTSMMTGVPPMRHGVLSWNQMRDDGSALQPTGRSARQVPAIWHLLEDQSIPTSVINFPATHPAQHLGATSVSNVFVDSTDPAEAAASVWPPALREDFSKLRIKPDEIDAASILSFIPKAAQINGRIDPRPGLLAQILAQTATVHAVITEALSADDWRFAALCYTGLQQICQAFMAYHPPRRGDVSEFECDLYQNVVTGAYRFHDLMLGRLLEMLGPATTVILVSNHGFGNNRPGLPIFPKTETELMACCRSEGMAVIAGPAIRAASSMTDLSLADIAPTILNLFGFQQPASMSGQAWEAVTPVKPLRDLDAKSRFERPDEQPPESWLESEAQKSIAFIKSLGYVEQEDQHARVARETLELDRQHIVALAWISAGQPQEALRVLEHITQASPANVEYQITLAQVCASLGRVDQFRQIAERFSLIYPSSPIAMAGMGIVEMLSENPKAAIGWLKKSEALAGEMPWLLLEIGRAYLRLKCWIEAKNVLLRAIASDEKLAQAYAELSTAQLALDESTAAVVSARRAVELRPTSPDFQRTLGLALLQTGSLSEARTALEAALSADPESADLLRTVAVLCEQHGDAARADELHRKLYHIEAQQRITPGLRFDMALRNRG
jgi:predicted AlkP superfamily phosphohydrolase/phosphomutase/Flp pilus assembly protein TadD